MKMLDETDTGSDENPAHDHRAEDAPEQHAMLLSLWDRKVVEYEEENEEIIYAQRELEQVSGDEFKSDLMSLPEIDNRRECRSETYIHSAPPERFSKPRTAAAPMQDPEVQHQHSKRESVEENPIKQVAILVAQGIVDR